MILEPIYPIQKFRMKDGITQDKKQSATSVHCYVNIPQHVQGRNVIY
jgi:hypothetical protein